MRKYKSIVFLIIASLILSFCLTGCELNDYARITDVQYQAVVVDEPGSEGKVVITERITFDVHAASRDNGFWELWRDLPESTIDGVKVHYKVNSVKQILPDGTALQWEESPQLYWDDYDFISPVLGPGKWFHSEGPYNERARQYECLLFYVDNMYREKITFEIEYEMYNAVLRYNDCSDLYISMYSGDTIKYLESYRGQILIPTKDMAHPGNYSVVTYGTTKNGFDVHESATAIPGYYSFSFNLDKNDLKFDSYSDFIEFDMVTYGADKHCFSENASINIYTSMNVLNEIFAEQAAYQAEVNAAQQNKIFVFVLCLCAAAAVVVLSLKKISDFKKKNPDMVTSSYKGTFREIPSDLDPKFAATLVFCKDKKQKDDAGVFSSLLLSLARKKYLDLKELSSKDVLITLIEDDASQKITADARNTSQNTGYSNGGYQTTQSTYSSFNTSSQFDAQTAYYSQTDAPRASKNPFGSMFEPAQQIKPQVTINSREPLTMCEEYYLNLIKHHSIDNCITMEVLQRRITADYDYTKNFSDNIKRSVVDIGIGQGYFQKADWQAPKKAITKAGDTDIGIGITFIIANLFTAFSRIGLAFGGFFLAAAICFATGIYLRTQAHKYVLLTSFGEDEYKKWRGLYNFLKSDTLINDKTFIELPLWEKYLVYATAFEISEKVIAAIKIRCPQAMPSQERSIVYNTYCRSGRIRTSGRTFHSSVHKGSVRSYSSYGGGGYGGGYSGGGFSSRGYGYGGGRGGGGGGGGH